MDNVQKPGQTLSRFKETRKNPDGTDQIGTHGRYAVRFRNAKSQCGFEKSRTIRVGIDLRRPSTILHNRSSSSYKVSLSISDTTLVL